MSGSIRTFDAAPCTAATIEDLDTQLISSFASVARRARGVSIAEKSSPAELLTQLHLLRSEHPTNGAVLLFAKTPQRLIPGAIVKAAHFAGDEVTSRPASRGRFKGNVFEVIDQSVEYILGALAKSAPREANSANPHEIPQEVIKEAMVNAVAHRDYEDERAVEVKVFSDRLEIWNPGSLPPSLTIGALRRPHESVPRNPTLAKCLFLAKYTERVGTGTRDMIMTSRGVGLAVPQFILKDGFLISFERQGKIDHA